LHLQQKTNQALTEIRKKEAEINRYKEQVHNFFDSVELNNLSILFFFHS